MLNSRNIDLPHNWEHVHLPETDSTMLLLRLPQYQHSDKEFVLATTDYQTAGRGQRGNHWEAERGKNLLFGFLFHPTLVPVTHQFALSEALALAVRAALAEHAGGGVTVKWPNDVYWHDYKIAGMLLEHDVCGTQIATTLTGVGINVNQTVFESDAPNPISLMKITGNHHSRAELFQFIRIVTHFKSFLSGFSFENQIPVSGISHPGVAYRSVKVSAAVPSEFLVPKGILHNINQ